MLAFGTRAARSARRWQPSLIRYTVDELEAWKRANDARHSAAQGNDAP
jgi:hypothetical protein